MSDISDIVTLIEAYAPGNVYTIASKELVLKGFVMYRGCQVRNISYDRDEKALIIEFEGGAVQTNIDSRGGVLSFGCNCKGQGRHFNCEHIVCTLITLKNLFNPALFKPPCNNEEKRNRLLSQIQALFSNGVKPGDSGTSQGGKVDGFVLCIERKGDDFIFYISERDINARLHTEPGDLPKTLKNLIYLSRYKRLDKADLYEYLKRHGNTNPIVFKAGRQVIGITWEAGLDLRILTSLNYHKSIVSVQREATLSGGREKRLFEAGGFVFDLDSKRFCFIEERNNWVLYTEIVRHYCREFYKDNDNLVHYLDAARIDMPYDHLNMLNIEIEPEGMEGFLNANSFLIEGRVRRPLRLRVESLSMEITERGEVYILTPSCIVNNVSIPPTPEPFKFFYNEIVHGLNSKNKRQQIYETYFEAMRLDKDADRIKVIKKGLPSAIFTKRDHKRRASDFLKYLVVFSSKRSSILHCERGEWLLVEMDKRELVKLFEIPYMTFGYGIYEGSVRFPHMEVRKKDFLPRMRQFIKLLNECGIETVFNGKKIGCASLEFDLSTVNTSIDWFELRPEIRCDGVEIASNLWADAIERGGFIEIDGTIRMIEQDSLNVLMSITKIAPKTTQSRREIFRIPKLAILDWISLRKRGVSIKLPPEDERIIERLMGFSAIEERDIPRGLSTTLRRYQKAGYYWLAFLYEHRFGGCLADDMGLGKTVQALTLLAGIKEGLIVDSERYRNIPNLIVVPPSLLFNWENEIGKFYPYFKVYSYTGKGRSSDFSGYEIILTTYALVRRDIDILKGINFNVIIFDEAQAVKNIFADTTTSVRQLTSRFKLTMTGTPIENHIGEYYSIMDLTLPGLTGSYREVSGRMDAERLEIFVNRTRPFVLRRTKGEILKELPPKVESDIYLELTPGQKALYNKTIMEVKNEIESAYRTKTESQARIIALTALLKLRQICLSPTLLLKDGRHESPKIEFLKEELTELYSEGYSALVFSQFTSFLDIVEGELKNTEYRLFRLDGSTRTPERKRLVESFMSSYEPSLFLLSLKAGGQGLNLTKASYIFHLDPWWNPAVENQASDRAHRIGQVNKVFVSRILMKHTIEEKIMELKGRKRALYDTIMGGHREASGVSLTRDDINYLINTL